MEQVMLGSSGIQASRVGLGTWAIGGAMWGGTDEKASISTIQAALDHGINLIDTAPGYGWGRSEELIGKAIKEYGHRDRIIIATKAGIVPPLVRNCTPESIREELEQSLRFLQTDYIDLYQIHWPDPLTPIETTAEILHAFYKEGKIRSIGVSNFSVEQMKKWLKIAPLHVCQPPLNIFERESLDAVLPFCRENGIATLLWSSLCRGLLTGKMKRNSRFEGDDIRNVDPKFQSPIFEQYLLAVEKLTALAAEYGKTIAQFAVRWVLDQPGASVALWGARTPEQLEPVKGINNWTISPEHMQLVEDILREKVTHPAPALSTVVDSIIPARTVGGI